MSKNRMKTLLWAITMTTVLFLPVTSLAQMDGYFKDVDYDSYNNRDAETNAFTNQTFGAMNDGYITNDQFGAPVGGGLLILFAAGVGYVALKSKKKISK